MSLPTDKPVALTDLDPYVINPNLYSWGEMLAPFNPPLPGNGNIVTVSCFGDVFVEDKVGAMWWLNGLEETVERIALRQAQYLERLAVEHSTMLKTQLLDLLIAADKRLPDGMIYGLKSPRAEGGKYHPDNVGTAPIADAFAYLGDRFRRRHAPPVQRTAADAMPGLAMPKLDKKAEKSGQKPGLWGGKKK